MPKQQTILNVFVASPSDVKDERDALESIILELNKTWSETLGIKFELLKWESDVTPGVSEYPQKVINEQINSYDVFIGMFWGRFGNPTPEFASATIEEFEIAYKKYQSNPSDIDILFYFKDKPISPSKLDPQSLKNIQEFKQSLPDKGVVYSKFESINDFETLLRTHLSKVAQKWLKKPNESQGVVEPSEKHVEIMLEDEDYGILDYLDIYEDRIEELTASLEQISSSTILIGKQFDKRAEQMELAKLGTTKDVKKIIKLTAEDLVRYSKVLDDQLNIYSSARRSAFSALSKGVTLQFELNEDTEQFNELTIEINELIKSAIEAEEGFLKFIKETENLPKLTTHLNKAKRIAVDKMYAVQNEIKATIYVAEEILKTIKQLKNDN